MYTHAYALSVSLSLSPVLKQLSRSEISSRPTRPLDTRIGWLLLSLCLVRPRPFHPRAPPTPPSHSRQVVSSPSTEIDATRGSRVQSATGHRVRNVVPSVLLLFCSGIPLVTNVIPPLLFFLSFPYPCIIVGRVFRRNKNLYSYAFINRMWIYGIESITCDVAADGVSTEFVSKWRERNEEGLGDRRGDGCSIGNSSMRVRETILRRSDVQRGATVEDNNRPAPQLC